MSVWVCWLDMVKYMVVRKNVMWHVSVYHTHSHRHWHFILDSIQGPFSMVFGSLQLTITTAAAAVVAAAK